MIFNIVFFISVTSVLIQGTTLSVVAKWLKVALPEKEKPVYEVDYFAVESPKSNMQEFKIAQGYFAINKRIVDLHFPKDAFIVIIKRQEQYIRPGGSTIIEQDDILSVAMDRPEDYQAVELSLKK